MKAITIDDVATFANVSKSTVSQYLNGRYEYMSDKTKIRIREAIEELGYQPNIIARSLKQKSTKTIGVIVANILHSFSTQVIRAIEDVFHTYDFHMIVCNADDKPEKEKKYIDMLRAKQVDGLIIFPTGGNMELYQKLIQGNFPLIFLDRFVKDLPIPSVMLDNFEASRLAVQYLHEQDCERIGIITASTIQNVSPRMERIQGFNQAMEQLGKPICPDYIHSVETHMVQNVVEKMIHLKQPPDGLIAGNDLTLLAILHTLKEKSVEMKLVGIDDVPFANLMNPPLTTIAQPTFDMGKAAAELLLKKINHEQEECTPIKRFPPTLLVR